MLEKTSKTMNALTRTFPAFGMKTLRTVVFNLSKLQTADFNAERRLKTQVY